MRSLSTSARRVSACGVLLASLLVASGTSGSPMAASSSPDSELCPDGVSSLRQRVGERNGEDPNSLTAAQAQRMDDRLQTEVGKLKKRGVLDKRGHMRDAKKVFTIKTHFHVITAADGSGGVTKQQIRDQVKVLNDAYAGKTSGKSTRSPFRFELASVDTTRNDDWFSWSAPDEGDTDDEEAKTALHRGSWDDLNVYLSGLELYLGYAYYPREVPLALDGVVVHSETLPGGDFAPYNEGDTLTHEVGHWLNLMHTFENGCTAPGDHVGDTPYQADGDNIFSCEESLDTCTQPGRDPVHNFMSYGDDPCLDRFTAGQQLRQVWSWLGQRYRQ